MSEILRATEEAFDRVRVACFTRDEPGFRDRRPESERYHATSAWGWARDRMWAQYADDHRGVCIAFDRTKLEEAFTLQLGTRGPHFTGDVVYTDERDETLVQVTEADLYLSKPKAVAASFRQRVAEQRAFRKRLDWAGEREYRLVLFDDQTSDPHVLLQVAGCIKALIVGDRFSEAYAPSVEFACAALRVRAFKIIYSGYISLVPYPQLRNERRVHARARRVAGGSR